MRRLTFALLLASATSVSAPAQTPESDWREAAEPVPRRERAPQPERQAAPESVPQNHPRRERVDRERRWMEIEPGREQRSDGEARTTAPPVPAVPQALPSGTWRGDRARRNGRDDILTTNPAVPAQPPAPNRRWQDRDDDDYRNRNDGRNWDRDRHRSERRDDGWHRDDRGRWERRDGEARDDNRRYDRRDWDRGWRYERRYDWRHYRNQFRDRYRAPRYYDPYGHRYGYRRFGIGLYIDWRYFGSRYWLNDPWGYRLPPAPYGCRWVRYYDDVLLVDTRSGYVVDVIHDFFW